MTHKDILDKWLEDEKAIFEGWDFAYLKGRMHEESPPWNYNLLAKSLVKKAHSVLDEATGGGEIFSAFAPFPKHAVATEGYKPNVSVAKKRLSLLGVKVIYGDESKKLPLKNAEFELILNRHGAFNAKELYRLLCLNGKLLTQQVDGANLYDLLKEFGVKPKWTFNTLKNRRSELVKAGFTINKAQEWRGRIEFRDVGAIVYWLKAIPWLVDGFSVRTYVKYLERLQKKLEKKGKLVYTLKRFMILAEK